MDGASGGGSREDKGRKGDKKKRKEQGCLGKLKGRKKGNQAPDQEMMEVDPSHAGPSHAQAGTSAGSSGAFQVVAGAGGGIAMARTAPPQARPQQSPDVEDTHGEHRSGSSKKKARADPSVSQGETSSQTKPMGMAVYLVVRRKKQSIYLEANDMTIVVELKRRLSPITKKAPEEMKLYNYKDKNEMEDHLALGYCGITSSNAEAQDPAIIGMVYYIQKDGEWDLEKLDIENFSMPPELPDVMKPKSKASTSPKTQKQVASSTS